MTHDELLQVVKGIEHDTQGKCGTKSLRAVVELHKPKNYILKEGEAIEQWCTGDTETLTKYPCPTIQAIEKELANG